MRRICLCVLLLLLGAIPFTAAHLGYAASVLDNLNGIALLSSSSGWAVGNSGTILHYDGSSWSLIPSGTTADLFSVSFGPPNAPNANSGFAVGGSGGAAVALAWSSVSWVPATSGLSGPDAQRLASVFALSQSDAWAVDGVSGAFWHWSGIAGLGGGWGEVGTASGGLNSVFMTDSLDGWAVGAGGIIYHYSGGGWSSFTNTGISLNSVFMVSPNEGWAVGNGGAIFHYLGGSWSGPVSPASTSQNLNSVFMTSQTEGWAVGASGTVLQYTNGAWTLVSNTSGVSQNLNGASFVGGIGFAVGDSGTIAFLGNQTPQGVLGATLESVYLSSSSDGWIVGCSTNGCGSGSGEPSILHWDGSSYFRGTASAPPSDLYSVFMVNPSEGWAVGGFGSTPEILHYTGGTWTQVPAPPVSGTLRSVFMVDQSDGWAVGDNGAILRDSGGSWGSVSSPTSNTLRSVFMNGQSDGWAVGDGGTILRFQTGQWTTYSSPTSSTLNDVFLLDANHGWAVGSSGTILHFDGNIWSPVATGSSANLNSISQINSGEAWAVGDSATILHWNGVSWYPYTPSPSLAGSPDLKSIFISPDGSGLIVGAPSAPGSQGTVLRVSSTPVPELPNQQVALVTVLLLALITVAIRRRKSSQPS